MIKNIKAPLITALLSLGLIGCSNNEEGNTESKSPVEALETKSEQLETGESKKASAEKSDSKESEPFPYTGLWVMDQSGLYVEMTESDGFLKVELLKGTISAEDEDAVVNYEILEKSDNKLIIKEIPKEDGSLLSDDEEHSMEISKEGHLIGFPNLDDFHLVKVDTSKPMNDYKGLENIVGNWKNEYGFLEVKIEENYFLFTAFDVDMGEKLPDLTTYYEYVGVTKDNRIAALASHHSTSIQEGTVPVSAPGILLLEFTEDTLFSLGQPLEKTDMQYEDYLDIYSKD